MQASAALARALELAREGRFRVAPNPPVGCVLVRRGRVVGEGRHGAWGGPHAEAQAIASAGAAARGATAYVTLEPCAHHGKTPPCADALLEAGVREVVYARKDPNPATAGSGPLRLREGGVRVRVARPSAGIRRLLRPYLAHLVRRRPWVVGKWAMTLDGRVATRTRDSKWISSAAARRWAHEHLRSAVDAILVGAGTVRQDDPALTNRSGSGSRPLRVVVCGRRALPRSARVLDGRGRTLLAAPEGFRAPKGAEVLRCGRNGRVHVRRLLEALHRRGLARVLVEGGPGLLGSLFDRGLVDQACVFVAPRLVGGRDAPGPLGGRGARRMADARDLDDPEWLEIGGDRIVEGYVTRPASSK